jgi:hypothetical protein
LWLEEQQELATDVGVLARDFWRMTPRAFAELVTIHRRREEREWERIAQLASWVMASWAGNSAPSRDELLGRVTNA